jgi:hypothetical protein
MCGRTAPPRPTTAPRTRRRSVQTLSRTTPLYDPTPRESGGYQGSRASRSPRAPRARAFDLVRARTRHRFTSAKGPARRTSSAPGRCPHQPPQPSPPRASPRIERPRTRRASRSRLGTITRADPQAPEAPRAEHGRRIERRHRITATNCDRIPDDTADDETTRSGYCYSPDAYPMSHSEPVLRKHQNRRLRAALHPQVVRVDCYGAAAR